MKFSLHSSPFLLPFSTLTNHCLSISRLQCCTTPFPFLFLLPLSLPRIVTRLASASDLHLQRQTRIGPPSMLPVTLQPHATTKLLSLSPEHLQIKHHAFPTVFWSPFPDGNLGPELNPKYLLVPALRSQLLFQIIRSSSA